MILTPPPLGTALGRRPHGLLAPRRAEDWQEGVWFFELVQVLGGNWTWEATHSPTGAIIRPSSVEREGWKHLLTWPHRWQTAKDATRAAEIFAPTGDLDGPWWSSTQG